MPWGKTTQHLTDFALILLDPTDVVLHEALHQYAKEKLTVAERLDRLRVEHNLVIKLVFPFLLVHFC